MYEQKLIDAIASGKLIEINGRVWHLQSNVEYLRQVMNFREKVLAAEEERLSGTETKSVDECREEMYQYLEEQLKDEAFRKEWNKLQIEMKES